MKGICVIAGAGALYDNEIAVEPGDLVIAADGGFSRLIERGVTPDLLMGDFDSQRTEPENVEILRFGAEKDDTDMMLAVKYGLERGYRAFRLYGGVGGRLSHTLANVQTLHFLSARGATGILYGDGVELTAVTNGAFSFADGARGMVSVFALSETARGVFIEGMKYPLVDALLTCDFPLGVSNELLGGRARVSVREGTLAIVWEKQEGV